MTMGTAEGVELGMKPADQTDRASSKAPVRIGLAGCGRLAEFGYLPAFRRASGVTLAGVADVTPHRCKQVAPEVPAFKTIHDLIQTDSMDAVIISTPTRYHLADATAASRAKLPILLEKPPGIDLSEAEALLGLAPRPWMGFNRRFDPDLARLRSNVPRDGMLVIRLELHYRRKSWNPFDMRDDALLDLGPHLIDLARWLIVSEVISVRAHALTQEHAEFELELGRGQATVICSYNSPYRELVQVRTSDGHRVGMFRRGGIVAGIIGKLSPWRENPLVTSLVGQLEAFGQVIRSDCTPTQLATAGDGVAVMSTIAAVRQSAMKGGSSCPVG